MCSTASTVDTRQVHHPVLTARLGPALPNQPVPERQDATHRLLRDLASGRLTRASSTEPHSERCGSPAPARSAADGPLRCVRQASRSQGNQTQCTPSPVDSKPPPLWRWQMDTMGGQELLEAAQAQVLLPAGADMHAWLPAVAAGARALPVHAPAHRTTDVGPVDGPPLGAAVVADDAGSEGGQRLGAGESIRSMGRRGESSRNEEGHNHGVGKC